MEDKPGQCPSVGREEIPHDDGRRDRPGQIEMGRRWVR